MLAVLAVGCSPLASPSATPSPTPPPSAAASPTPPPASSSPSPSPTAVAAAPTVVGEFATDLLPEASGIAVGRRDPEVRWLVDDGPVPRVVAVGSDGTRRGVVQLDVPTVTDVEDLAVGPCPESDAPCLWVADTGDNVAGREQVRLFVLPEPDPVDATVRPDVLPVVLPEGPVDIEALVVTPQGDAVLLTKQEARTVLLAVPDDGGTAVRLAELSVPEPSSPLLTEFAGLSVTAADLAADGRRLLLRTYDQVLLLTSPDDPPDLAAVDRWEVEELAAPPEFQGEALAWLGDDAWVSASEGNGQLWRGEVP